MLEAPFNVSFWDHLKPATRTPQPANLSLSDDRHALQMTWDDGRTSAFSARLLRQRCPCAACVEEWTQRQTLDMDSVPPSLSILELTLVGNYAVALAFSDGHRTGIYPWPLLRALDEATGEKREISPPRV